MGPNCYPKKRIPNAPLPPRRGRAGSLVLFESKLPFKTKAEAEQEADSRVLADHEAHRMEMQAIHEAHRVELEKLQGDVCDLQSKLTAAGVCWECGTPVPCACVVWELD